MKIFNIDDNVTDDVINTGDEFFYIKNEKIKNACNTEIAEILLNEEYDYDFTRKSWLYSSLISMKAWWW